MTTLYFIGTLALPCLAVGGMAYAWGKGQGEAQGYALGYREGAFDVANGLCCGGAPRGDHAQGCASWSHERID